ncbi:AmmeMemoRadiSam system protein B [Acidobacteriota bacterium]
MKKKRLTFLFILSFTLVFSGPVLFSQGIRRPVHAGRFYPRDTEALSRMIDSLMKTAEKSPRIQGKILALIAPHAGYPYSGKTAALAYSQVRDKSFDSVVILSPSHQHGFNGASIYSAGSYETPLGNVAVDTDLAERISQRTGFKYISKAHIYEHAVEVQLPFIQKVLPLAKIVPIVMGLPNKKTIVLLAEALSEIVKDNNVLIVASTDMSHQLQKDAANKVDRKTIALIEEFRTDSLVEKLEQQKNIMCGGGPVATVLYYSKKKNKARVNLLDYTDSSETTGDAREVVGYMAAAIIADVPQSQSSPLPQTLSEGEKKELLEIARAALDAAIRKGEGLEIKPTHPRLETWRGAFVTLRESGTLRGCIGFVDPVLPLYQAVMQAAIYAALRDPRFQPVRAEELEDIEIEISVLSNLTKIGEIQKIQVGKHGLVISWGERSGLLLPQVAVENNWSRLTFLEQACIKAGLTKNAWRNGADIFIFEALIIH